jgi:hypothetical protein
MELLVETSELLVLPFNQEAKMHPVHPSVINCAS